MVLAGVHDEGTPVDVPDGWKVDPKRTSFVEVGTLRDQRSSLAVSLISSTVSSQQLKQDIEEEDEITIGSDVNTPGSKHSSSSIFVSYFCTVYRQNKKKGTYVGYNLAFGNKKAGIFR